MFYQKRKQAFFGGYVGYYADQFGQQLLYLITCLRLFIFNCLVE